jgi:AICAR transformylase/IMP cyclohydrolase PurH
MAEREITLKYGLNPHQRPARAVLPEPAPLRVLNGEPGYINLLDALSGFRLVRELRAATGKAAAACFKHVSPAGAAVAGDLSADFLRAQFLEPEALSPVANAYVRARGGDRLSAFGDFAAVSEVVDESLARVLAREVSDGIIAPGFTPEARRRLARKKNGTYLLLEMDAGYEGPAREVREIMGIRFEQENPPRRIDAALFANIVSKARVLPAGAVDTLIVATVALRYAQSNSVCVAWDGQVVGMGAGQQSRIHCTRLACDKADKWFLTQHPAVLSLPFGPGLGRPERANLVDQFLLLGQLSPEERAQFDSQLAHVPAPIDDAARAAWLRRFDGICLSSDAFLPFRDNVDRAARSNVQAIAQAGGSARDDDVTAAADAHGIVMLHTGLRLFTH